MALSSENLANSIPYARVRLYLATDSVPSLNISNLGRNPWGRSHGSCMIHEASRSASEAANLEPNTGSLEHSSIWPRGIVAFLACQALAVYNASSGR